MERKDKVAVVVSVLALAVSIMTLYFSFLSSPRVSTQTGEYLHVAHVPLGNTQCFSLNLSVSYVNQGSRTGLIRRFGLQIRGPNSEKVHFLEAAWYQRISHSGTFVGESYAHPIGVLGRSSGTKNIQFLSQAPPNAFTVTEPGRYKLDLLCWVNSKSRADVMDSFEVEISDDNVADIQKKLHNQGTVRLQKAGPAKQAREIGLATSGWSGALDLVLTSATAAAAVAAWLAVRTTRNATQGSVFLQVLQDYDSKEMYKALFTIGKQEKMRDADREGFARFLDEMKKDPPKLRPVDECRRRVSHFWLRAAELSRHGLISDHQLHHLCGYGSFKLLFSVIEPMERAVAARRPGGKYSKEAFDYLLEHCGRGDTGNLQRLRAEFEPPQEVEEEADSHPESWGRSGVIS